MRDAGVIEGGHFRINFSSCFEQIHGDNVASIIQDEDEDKDKIKFYAMWTKKNHVVASFNTETRDVVLSPILGNEEMINPIGRIPAVFLQKGDESSVPSRPSLPFNDIEINACESVLLTGCDIQALGKLIVKHPDSQSMPSE